LKFGIKGGTPKTVSLKPQRFFPVKEPLKWVSKWWKWPFWKVFLGNKPGLRRTEVPSVEPKKEVFPFGGFPFVKKTRIWFKTL